MMGASRRGASAVPDSRNVRVAARASNKKRAYGWMDGWIHYRLRFGGVLITMHMRGGWKGLHFRREGFFRSSSRTKFGPNFGEIRQKPIELQL